MQIQAQAVQPEKKFRAGGISATIWQNAGEKGNYATVKLSRSYKDKDNQWKETNSFRATDIPKALLVLQKSYEYLELKGGIPAEPLVV